MYKILLIFNTLRFLKFLQIFFIIKKRVYKKNLFYLQNSHFKKRPSVGKWVDDIPKSN
jgi:hypothetical protein